METETKYRVTQKFNHRTFKFEGTLPEIADILTSGGSAEIVALTQADLDGDWSHITTGPGLYYTPQIEAWDHKKAVPAPEMGMPTALHVAVHALVHHDCQGKMEALD